jgi:uncharacterized protein YacL
MQAVPTSKVPIDYVHSEIPALTHPISRKRHYYNLVTYYGTLIWENTIIIVLSLQSLDALYKAGKFIIDDYPLLELQFKSQHLHNAEITHIITEAVGLMLGTIINILFAIRLSKAQERVSRYLELVAGTALIVWYLPLMELLKSLDYEKIITFVRSFIPGL